MWDQMKQSTDLLMISRPDSWQCKEGEKLMASERQASALQVEEELPTNLQSPFNRIPNAKSHSQKTLQSHNPGVKLASNESNEYHCIVF